MPVINVELGERSYPIIIERGLVDRVGRRLTETGLSGRAAVVTNPLVDGLYGDRLMASLAGAGFDPFKILVPDGEEFKTLESASMIYDRLIEERMERGWPVVSLGGGVIGDLAGFVAATYLRGVPYVQVPTTLLAQVDSSVGGKTAVNHPKGKNLIGAFYQPGAVLIDPDTLATLDVREIRAGMAEVVKYGVIRDEAFFLFIEEKAAEILALGEAIVHVIGRSCEIKAEVVEADERETTGTRAILNFGHTFGHAIESLTGYGTWRHGEAVAMGMVLAAGLSARVGLCGPEVEERIARLLATLGLPVKPPELPPERVIESLRLDKKVRAGRIRFVLAHRIGEVELRDVPEDEIIAFLLSRYSAPA